MILTIKKEFIIKIFLVILLISLNLMIIINGINLSCDNCQIKFYSEKISFREAYDSPLSSFKINITDLYTNLKNDNCLVQWDKINGYYLNKIK